ncbi:ABC transporter permease [Planomonospora parontospora]|uniref:ABC transporter permease n=1 Tax=Planomonospora parontospora TaxID=58119 RepID=UPI001671798B|nr:ABC transporter permease [Planomonospora parontospora]GGL29166.1 transport permease protein [Planomonospora parontospora subsp. antibiotica]GII19192.1 transport permease protein [Planomonospora parontospora subsp. antibiotica]
MSVLNTAPAPAAPVTAARGSATWRLIKAESRLSIRDKVGPLWGVGCPLIVLIILGLVPALREPVPTAGGLTYFDLYVPVLILFNLAILAMTALPTTLAGYRENGVLRRMQTTPIGPARVLGAQLAANFAIALVATVLFLAVAGLGFGVDLPRHPVGFVLAWLLATAALLAIGLLITALAPGRGPATAIGTVLFFPMMFFAGLWVPVAQMPEALQTISHYTPLGAGMQAFQEAYLGSFPPAAPLLTLAAYAAGCTVIAVRWFRWE